MGSHMEGIKTYVCIREAVIRDVCIIRGPITAHVFYLAALIVREVALEIVGHLLLAAERQDIQQLPGFTVGEVGDESQERILFRQCLRHLRKSLVKAYDLGKMLRDGWLKTVKHEVNVMDGNAVYPGDVLPGYDRADVSLHTFCKGDREMGIAVYPGDGFLESVVTVITNETVAAVDDLTWTAPALG